MRKIPTVFKRDPEDLKRVLAEVTPGCEWVLAGEGTPTRKYDGTCVMFDGRRWWARRGVRAGHEAPPGFHAVELDEVTGKTMGWEPVGQSTIARWHAQALSSAAHWSVGTYELCGPKVNANPEGYEAHRLIRHADAERVGWPPIDSFAAAKALVRACAADGWEGVVWRHPDGRMAKLKGRDFPSSADIAHATGAIKQAAQQRWGRPSPSGGDHGR